MSIAEHPIQHVVETTVGLASAGVSAAVQIPGAGVSVPINSSAGVSVDAAADLFIAFGSTNPADAILHPAGLEIHGPPSGSTTIFLLPTSGQATTAEVKTASMPQYGGVPGVLTWPGAADCVVNFDLISAPTPPFTVLARMKPAALTQSPAYAITLSAAGTDVNDAYVSIRIQSGSPNHTMQGRGDPTDQAAKTAGLNADFLDDWCLVAFEIDAANIMRMRLWSDTTGELVTQNPFVAPTWPTFSVLSIGGDPAGGNSYAGSMAGVLVYDAVLSVPEFTAVRESLLPLAYAVPDSSLIVSDVPMQQESPWLDVASNLEGAAFLGAFSNAPFSAADTFSIASAPQLVRNRLTASGQLQQAYSASDSVKFGTVAAYGGGMYRAQLPHDLDVDFRASPAASAGATFVAGVHHIGGGRVGAGFSIGAPGSESGTVNIRPIEYSA